MRMSIGKVLCMLVAAAVLQVFGSSASAVSTMADWTGKNNVLVGVVQPFSADAEVRNNYGLISNTAVGGQLESKLNFLNDPVEVTAEEPNDFQHVYFSDPTLEGPTLDFTTPLHMDGTITFNSPTATEPNLLFGWYNSADTRHRIGFGISNLSNPNAVAGRLRLDFGYASTSYANPNPPPTNLGNRFFFVSADGTASEANNNSLIPSGSYPFSFDYVPGPQTPGGGSGTLGGSMIVTVGDFFRSIVPLDSEPEDFDIFNFDRFGLLQRATANANQHGVYDVVFSNVTYTGGTEYVEGADFNSSGNVNGDDLAIWAQNFGTTGDGATFALGNADGGSLVAPITADIDGDDFLVWQRTYNGGSPVAAVPEPSAMALLALGGISALMRRTRRT